MSAPDPADRWRRWLAESHPDVDALHLDAVAEALARQHDHPDEHDRSLIAERLAWSPARRLREHQAWLDLLARARPPIRRD